MKICAYTVIVGEYDSLNSIDPEYRESNIDYYLVTDSPNLYKNQKYYKVIKCPNEYNNNKINSRIPKFQPHRFFEKYDISIYYDGKKKIINKLSPLIDMLEDNDFLISNHWSRTSIFQEADLIIRAKHDDKNRVINTINMYKDVVQHGDNLLFENSMMVRRHNNKYIIDMCDKLMVNYSSYSLRDQLHLPYFYELYKNSIKFKRCKFSYFQKYFKNVGHKKKRLKKFKR